MASSRLSRLGLQGDEVGGRAHIDDRPRTRQRRGPSQGCNWMRAIVFMLLRMPHTVMVYGSDSKAEPTDETTR